MSNIDDENKDIYSKLLKLGLDKNEAMTYLSLLKLGEVGASKIVKDTSLHGQTVYNALDNLESKNLIKFTLINGRKKFSAQSPSILIDLIEKQKTIATDIAEDIEKRFSTVDIQSIEIIKGKESFISLEFKLLEECHNGSEILVFGGPGDSYIKNLGRNFNEYEYKRKKKEVAVKYLGIKEQEQYLRNSVNERYQFDYRILSGVLSGVTNLCVFDNSTVAIYLYDETVTLIIIRNKKVAKSYADFFESLWKIG